jgi:hypothetical protein
MVQMVSENGGFDQVDHQKITSNQPQVAVAGTPNMAQFHGVMTW